MKIGIRTLSENLVGNETVSDLHRIKYPSLPSRSLDSQNHVIFQCIT